MTEVVGMNSLDCCFNYVHFRAVTLEVDVKRTDDPSRSESEVTVDK